jgi:hypothetical protein
MSLTRWRFGWIYAVAMVVYTWVAALLMLP